MIEGRILGRAKHRVGVLKRIKDENSFPGSRNESLIFGMKDLDSRGYFATGTLWRKSREEGDPEKEATDKSS